MRNYLHEFEPAQMLKVPSPILPKRRVWNELANEVKKGLVNGNGYELSTIRDGMTRLLTETEQATVNIENRDVKRHITQCTYTLKEKDNILLQTTVVMARGCTQI